MAQSISVCLVSCCLVAGCYDFTFEEDEHTVTGLKVMAIHLEPPEIRAGEPIDAEVLFADPLAGERPVWFAWRAVFPVAGDSGRNNIKTSVATDAEAGYRFSVTPLDAPLSSVSQPFSTRFEVFLCSGALGDPSKLENLPTSKLFDGFCSGAPLLAASKRAELADPEYPQNNPGIDRLFLNGAALAMNEEKGAGVMPCGAIEECVATLEVYLTDDSQETFASRDFEGKIVSEEFQEALQVEWYVSGGRLSQPLSYAWEWQGPYTNRWTPEATGPHTLWAIVRDGRGGNSWRLFDIEVVTSPR